jgi:hypothetical protein
MLYQGNHRRVGARVAFSKLPIALVGGALLWSVVATGTGVAAPRGCIGAPTAIVISQGFSAPDGFRPVTISYQVLQGNEVVATASVTVAPGATAYTTVGGLSRGTYTVRQIPDLLLVPAPDATAEVDPPDCPDVVSFVAVLSE